MNTILVLGGSGFVGSNICKLLLDNGCSVINCDIKPPDLTEIGNTEKYAYIPFDLSDMKSLDSVRLAKQADVVIHLVSRLIPGSSFLEYEADFGTTFKSSLLVIDQLLDMEINRVVFLSTGGAIYENSDEPHPETDPIRPISYYGLEKHITEEYIRFCARKTDLQYLILRPSNLYGPHQKLRGKQGLISAIYGNIIDKTPIEIWGDGTVVRDYLYIDDFCQTLVSLLSRPCWNQTLNVGSGEGNSVNAVIELAKSITGSEVEVIRMPKRSVDIQTSLLNITRLKQHVSFVPISLECGMSRYWNHIKKDLHA